MNDKLKSWEYPKDSGIRIREKINTSGVDAYGISYTVTIPVKITGGARIRKQFKTLDEAEQYAKKESDGAKIQGQAFFEATDQERREFADVLQKLRDSKVGLREAVEFAIPRLRPAGGDRTFSAVIEEIRQDKSEMLEDGTMRENSEKAFRIRSSKIRDAFGSLLVRDLTKKGVEDWLSSLDLAPRTKKNAFYCLAEVLLHSIARKYVFENILDGFTKKDRAKLYGREEEQEPEILTIKEANSLICAAIEYPKLDMLAAVTLGLFCGIRTEEIKKLKWEDVHLDEGFVKISKDIAKKRSIRNVTLSENAKQWLTLCPNRSGQVTRSNYTCDFDGRFNKLVKHAGFTKKVKDGDKDKVVVAWKKNAMRHSFGSYHFALNGDSIKTSNELGHKQGDGVLFAHYRALSTKKQGTEYFAIAPEASLGKVVGFAS